MFSREEEGIVHHIEPEASADPLRLRSQVVRSINDHLRRLVYVYEPALTVRVRAVGSVGHQLVRVPVPSVHSPIAKKQCTLNERLQCSVDVGSESIPPALILS